MPYIPLNVIIYNCYCQVIFAMKRVSKYHGLCNVNTDNTAKNNVATMLGT